MLVLWYVLGVDGDILDLGNKPSHICGVCQPVIASSEEQGWNRQLCHIVAGWCGLAREMVGQEEEGEEGGREKGEGGVGRGRSREREGKRR